MKTRIIYLLLLIIVVIICSRVVSTERSESRYIVRTGWPGVTVTAQKLNCGLDECTPILPDRGAWSFRQWYWSEGDLDATHRVLRDLPFSEKWLSLYRGRWYPEFDLKEEAGILRDLRGELPGVGTYWLEFHPVDMRKGAGYCLLPRAIELRERGWAFHFYSGEILRAAPGKAENELQETDYTPILQVKSSEEGIRVELPFGTYLFRSNSGDASRRISVYKEGTEPEGVERTVNISTEK